MPWWSFLSKQPAAAHPCPARGLGGMRARASVDHDAPNWRGALATVTTLAPRDSLQQWRALDLDARTLDRINPADLLDLMVDVSPDISRALWDFLRMCNPGWTATVLRPSGQPAPQTAQQALTAIQQTLTAIHTDINVPINRLFTGAWLRGAFMAELVLDEAGRMVVDLATPNPGTARFRPIADPLRGPIWQLGQWQSGQFVALDRPTIRYVPVDPLPGSPYGRPLAHPAIVATLFTLALLNDVRRVVQQQGYPRLDLAVDLQALADAAPGDVTANPDAWQAWVNEIIHTVATAYSGLEPDDAYVHTNVVTVNRPVGAVESSSLGAIVDIMRILEQQAVRALKTMPLMMGMADGTSEANANRQWEIYAAGIKAIQHLGESLLESLLTLALEAQGVPGIVQVRFAELRAAELLRDAQVQALTITNARNAYAAGYLSQDEAAMRAVGKEQADVPAPRDTDQTSAPAGAQDAQPDPGANRQNGGLRIDGGR